MQIHPCFSVIYSIENWLPCNLEIDGPYLHYSPYTRQIFGFKQVLPNFFCMTSVVLIFPRRKAQRKNLHFIGRDDFHKFEKDCPSVNRVLFKASDAKVVFDWDYCECVVSIENSFRLAITFIGAKIWSSLLIWFQVLKIYK